MTDQYILFIGFAVPLTQHCSDIKSRLFSDNSTVDTTRPNRSSFETQMLQNTQIGFIQNLKTLFTDFKALEIGTLGLRFIKSGSCVAGK